MQRLTVFLLVLSIFNFIACSSDKKSSNAPQNNPVVFENAFELETFVGDIHVGATENSYVGRISVKSDRVSDVDSIELTGTGSEKFRATKNGDIYVNSGVTLDEAAVYQLGARATRGEETTQEAITLISVVEQNASLRHYGQNKKLRDTDRVKSYDDLIIAYNYDSAIASVYQYDPNSDNFLKFTSFYTYNNTGTSRPDIAINSNFLMADHEMYRLDRENRFVSKIENTKVYDIVNETLGISNDWLDDSPRLKLVYLDRDQNAAPFQYLDGFTGGTTRFTGTMVESYKDFFVYLYAFADEGEAWPDDNWYSNRRQMMIYRYNGSKYEQYKQQLAPQWGYMQGGQLVVNNGRVSSVAMSGDFLTVCGYYPDEDLHEGLEYVLAYIYRMNDSGEFELMQTLTDTLDDGLQYVDMHGAYMLINTTLYRFDGSSSFVKIHEYDAELRHNPVLDNDKILLSSSSSLNETNIYTRGIAFKATDKVELKGTLGSTGPTLQAKNLQGKRLQALSDIGDISQIIATGSDGEREVIPVDEFQGFDLNVTEQQNYLIGLYDDYFNLKGVLGYGDQEMVPLFNTQGGSTIDFGQTTLSSSTIVSSQSSFETLGLATAAQNEMMAKLDQLILTQAPYDLDNDGKGDDYNFTYVPDYDARFGTETTLEYHPSYTVGLERNITNATTTIDQLTQDYRIMETYDSRAFSFWFNFFEYTAKYDINTKDPDRLDITLPETFYSYQPNVNQKVAISYGGADQYVRMYVWLDIIDTIEGESLVLPQGDYLFSLLTRKYYYDADYNIVEATIDMTLDYPTDITYPIGLTDYPQLAIKLNASDAGSLETLDYQWVVYSEATSQWITMTSDMLIAFRGPYLSRYSTFEGPDVRIAIAMKNGDVHYSKIAKESVSGEINQEYGSDLFKNLNLSINDIESIEILYSDFVHNIHRYRYQF